MTLECGAIECGDSILRLLGRTKCSAAATSLPDHDILAVASLLHMFLQSLVEVSVSLLLRWQAADPHLSVRLASELAPAFALALSTKALAPALHRHGPTTFEATPSLALPPQPMATSWLTVRTRLVCC